MNFSGKNVLLLGFGGEARAALTYLHKHFTQVTINIADHAQTLPLSEEERLLVNKQFLGSDWLDSLDQHQVIIRSPGVPLSALSSIQHNPEILVTSGTNLFLEKHAKKTVAVTGTKGKSTTSSLLFAALQAQGLNVILGGNIGIPALSLIDQNPELFVLELSSYQLEDCNYSPYGAVLLNLYEEHLDHHGCFSDYASAKARISQFQNENDFLILPSENPELHNLTSSHRSKLFSFGDPSSSSWIENDYYMMRLNSGEAYAICNTSETKLKGPGNKQNILAVLATLSRFKINAKLLADTICKFSPLPHRLEEVGVKNGICFINDSISTVPEATINALETFGSKVRTLILGGFDRGVSFERLSEYLTSSAVDTILLFPPSGERIRHSLLQAEERSSKRFQILSTNSMEHAVTLANDLTPEGHICLLSPASPSFPLFKNFEERGSKFKEAVLRLSK